MTKLIQLQKHAIMFISKTFEINLFKGKHTICLFIPHLVIDISLFVSFEFKIKNVNQISLKNKQNKEEKKLKCCLCSLLLLNNVQYIESNEGFSSVK